MDQENAIHKLKEEIYKLSEDIEQSGSKKKYFYRSKDLDLLLASGPVVCSVFNHTTFRYDYVSPNVERMLGISAEHLMEMNYEEFLRLYIHPDDLQVVSMQLLSEVVNFIYQKPKKEKTKISVHFNYRIKAACGKWIQIEQQMSPVKIDKQGKVLLDQSFYIQVGEVTSNGLYHIKLSIFFRDADGLYQPQFSKSYLSSAKGEGRLTKREFEILQMLAAGKSSSMIGKTLNIGLTTVISHRRNMLKKFSLQNTNELIAYAFKAGFLIS